jgi:hypothetical protein
MHKSRAIRIKGGCDGFQTCNAGRAEAHLYRATRADHRRTSLQPAATSHQPLSVQSGTLSLTMTPDPEV